MGKIFSGGGKQTTTQSSAPWKEAQPYLKDIYGQAQKLYGQGAPDYWQGMANAPLTPEMQAALGSIWNRGMAGNPLLPGAIGSTGAVASGGLVGSNPAYDFLMSTMYGEGGNPAMGMAGDLAGDVMGGTNPAIDYLTQEASGANVGKNPWLDQMFGTAADKIKQQFRETTVPGLQSDYALSGRYGSNALRNALTNAQGGAMEATTDLATKLYGGAYDADRARQAAAMGQLSGAYAQDIQNKIGAGGFLSGIYDTDLQRKLYAAQQTGQLGQMDITNMLNAAGMAPELGNAQYTDLDRLLQIGQFGQGRSQDELGLERERFEYGQNAPMNWLQQYANLVYGNPGSTGYGTTTTTQKQSGGGFGSILGGIMGLGSMVAGAPQIGAGFNYLFR